ncbi:MAG: hypothetical protein AAFZ52_09735 [Bacteroidota bacterium]
MKSFFLLLLLLFISGLLPAQTEVASGGWSVETDPFSTAFGAKTLSVTIEPRRPEHWSLFLNVVSADFPGWMDDFLNPKNKGKAFDPRIRLGGGFGVDYFFRPERTGTYVGLLNLFFQNELRGSDNSVRLLTHNMIPRVGYRWYPFTKLRLYLNPFVGLRYEHAFGKRWSLAEEAFTPAGLQPFGTMHIGYRF